MVFFVIFKAISFKERKTFELTFEFGQHFPWNFESYQIENFLRKHLFGTTCGKIRNKTILVLFQEKFWPNFRPLKLKCQFKSFPFLRTYWCKKMWFLLPRFIDNLLTFSIPWICLTPIFFFEISKIPQLY